MDDDKIRNELVAFSAEPRKKSRSGLFIYGILLGLTIGIVWSFVFAGVARSLPFGVPLGGAKTSTDAKVQRILQILDAQYVDSFDKEQAIESMYAGLVYGLGDPYTSYMDQKTLTTFMEQTEGTYAGIGVVVSIAEDNRITVVTPFEGYPGAKAGILPGDKIIRVNDSEVSGDVYEEAIAMLKGMPGTSVNVTIFRESENRTIELTILREQIDIPTVSHRMLDDQVGYIRITNFDRVTYNQFLTAYEDLNSQHMRGLIIDLRNNPGGLLNIVTDMTNLLVPEGYIVYTEDKNGKREYTYSDDTYIEIPLVLIVNSNSASASEVMAGAVKDMGMGELVGTQTFGKGLVQNLFDLRDGTALKITIAKYYTPSGVCINGEGITPHHIVDMPNELTTRLSSLSLEEDPQLQKAIEVVLGKIRN